MNMSVQLVMRLADGRLVICMLAPDYVLTEAAILVQAVQPARASLLEVSARDPFAVCEWTYGGQS